MMSAQAGVRRVPWRSRRERTGDSSIDWELMNGAKGGTRTPTPLRAQEPESCASTNSATFARKRDVNVRSRPGGCQGDSLRESLKKNS